MKKALVLVAHADDETLGAGGMIQKLIAKQWEVKVVVVADGLVSVRGKIQDNRPGTYAACKILGAPEPTFLGYKDQRFDSVAIADIANSVFDLGYDPDLVLTHVETDLNLDHRIVTEVARIIARPKRKAVAIVGCEIPNTSFWNCKQFPANYFIDISNELANKIKAFTCYENELQAYPHPWSERGLELLAQYHGMQAGMPYAEAFHVYRGYESLLP